MERLNLPHIEKLIDALLLLRNREECRDLLEDLMTIKEIQDLAQRLEVARLLREKITYNEIKHMTGVSTATISRVNRSLSYGAGGYEMILKRAEQNPAPARRLDSGND